MGKFITKSNAGYFHYDTITSKAFKNILSFGMNMKSYTFRSGGRLSSGTTYFDTPENLLTKTGILLYKSIENGKCFLKLEKMSFLPKVFKVQDEEIFVHEIQLKDRPQDHSFYLIDAIINMFSTSFTVDLENVLKNVVPKLIININAQAYKVFSGSGFKANLFLEDVIYTNLQTKKKAKTKEVGLVLDGGKSFINAFNDFNALLNKHCKDLIEIQGNLYDRAINKTKIIAVQPKKKPENEKKDKK